MANAKCRGLAFEGGCQLVLIAERQALLLHGSMLALGIVKGGS